jgi:cation diffusion facilitator CzcD-associated flavoprotein CzcO
VIGGGPAGLAMAGALRLRGLDAVVLEAGALVGSSWRHHYDRLHLHTIRSLSGLPGLSIPRGCGRYVARLDLVRYLEQYAMHFDLEVHPGVRVTGLEPVGPRRPDGARWRVTTDSGAELHARTVIVATGHNHTPRLLDQPGSGTFRGPILHASDYRDGSPFRGRDVLVVGTGNTGAEIAVDLAEHGAKRVRIAVRTPPHLVRRDVGPVPNQVMGVLVRRLPDPLVDRIAAIQVRLSVPDLSPFGLPRPPPDLATRIRRDGSIPTQDVGLIDAVRSGRVEPVPAILRFEEGAVRLADGSLIRPDAVIAATGYRRGLESMVGGLGVLDESGRPVRRGGRPAAPGLYFLGYSIVISGALREIGIEARRIARRERLAALR